MLAFLHRNPTGVPPTSVVAVLRIAWESRPRGLHPSAPPALRRSAADRRRGRRRVGAGVFGRLKKGTCVELGMERRLLSNVSWMEAILRQFGDWTEEKHPSMRGPLICSNEAKGGYPKNTQTCSNMGIPNVGIAPTHAKAPQRRNRVLPHHQ